MPLEDLEGTVYIDALNELWPLGTDFPADGDDHLRGIKNVLKNSFPNLTGPITLSQDELNRGSIPAGAVMLFYNAAAPEGWTRVAGITATRALRVVASTEEGGAQGGSDDPIRNDVVVSHTHKVQGNTGGQSVSHAHSGNTNYDGEHNHRIGIKTHYASGSNRTGPAGSDQTSTSGSFIEDESNHRHSFSTGDASVSHSHYTNLTSAVPAGATVGVWTPRYLDVILCKRD